MKSIKVFEFIKNKMQVYAKAEKYSCYISDNKKQPSIEIEGGEDDRLRVSLYKSTIHFSINGINLSMSARSVKRFGTNGSSMTINKMILSIER